MCMGDDSIVSIGRTACRELLFKILKDQYFNGFLGKLKFYGNVEL